MLCANEEDKQSVGNPPQVRNTDREQRRASGLIVPQQGQHKTQAVS